MPLAQATVSEASVSPTTGYVRLHLPRGMATVVLDDTDAGRAFSSELPLELDLRDPMGQAKSGRLPHPIDVAATGRVVDPEVGILYYWPQSGDIAIYYDDLGQTVPPTGLVRLGVVASGMEVLAEAGSRFAVQIER